MLLTATNFMLTLKNTKIILSTLSKNFVSQIVLKVAIISTWTDNLNPWSPGEELDLKLYIARQRLD